MNCYKTMLIKILANQTSQERLIHSSIASSMSTLKSHTTLQGVFLCLVYFAVENTDMNKSMNTIPFEHKCSYFFLCPSHPFNPEKTPQPNMNFLTISPWNESCLLYIPIKVRLYIHIYIIFSQLMRFCFVTFLLPCSV